MKSKKDVDTSESKSLLKSLFHIFSSSTRVEVRPAKFIWVMIFPDFISSLTISFERSSIK